MSKMKQNLAAMLAMTMAMDNGQGMMFTGSGDDAYVLLPPKPPIPNGSKEYFFNERGKFSTEQMRKSECVFECVAINDKNAKRKFTKWLNSHPL
jgi:hypothetical protein